MICGLYKGLGILWTTALPAPDFDPLGISKIYNIKTLCNYEIINKLFYQKNDFICGFIVTLNHFLPYKPVCYWEDNVIITLLICSNPYVLINLCKVSTLFILYYNKNVLHSILHINRAKNEKVRINDM